MCSSDIVAGVEFGTREAVRDDADEIADAHIAAWRIGYRHIFPSAILDVDEFERSRREIWRAWTHSPTDDRRLLVAEAGGRVVGFAHTGDADETPGSGADRRGELFGFYVHPDVWGSGAAARLMAAAIEHLDGLGHDQAILWTLRDARRAQAFYAKSGWAPSGRTKPWDRYPDHPVVAVEYTIDLDAEP